jgi:hypothetical protein
MWQVCSDSRIKPEIKRDIHNNAAVLTSSGIEDRPSSGKSGSFMAALVTSWIRSQRRRNDPVSCLRKSKVMLYYLCSRRISLARGKRRREDWHEFSCTHNLRREVGRRKFFYFFRL